MKKIIPFKKEIEFDTNIYEITSISLEHTIDKNVNTIKGNFDVDGEYRVTETSMNTLPFSYSIPFTIEIDDIYDSKDANVDVSDFYYEIINNKVLSVNIEVKIDGLKEILVERHDTEINNIEIDDSNVIIDSPVDTNINSSLFANLDSTDNYVTYKICIVREGDTLDSIMSKYNVTKDILEQYNDITNIKLGDKIIIPYVKV